MPVDLNLLAEDLHFPEGPCFDSQGNLWCTEILGGSLVRYNRRGLTRFQVGDKVNGAAFDRQDRLWFTDSAQNRVQIFDPKDESIQTVCDQVEGRPLARPNDLAFDQAGNLIVSCHADSRTQPDGYLIVIDKDQEARVVARNKYFPNGIAFSADGACFVYSETYRRRLWKVEWDKDTLEITRETVWAETSGPLGPDGIAFDARGYLYVTVFDQAKIEVFDPNGQLTDTFPLPYMRPTSCAFDPNEKLGLVVTEAEKGLLLSLNLSTQGQPIFYR